MQMDRNQANKWNKRTTGELYIKDEAHFRNSDLFLNNYSDIKDTILSVLNGQLSQQEFFSKYRELKNPYYQKRIKADSLNKGIRNRFLQSSLDFQYEVKYDEGVFFDSLKTTGFDFAYIDNNYNLVNFRNLCLGRRAIFNGEKLWKEKLSNNHAWNNLSKKLKVDKVSHGVDMQFKKQTPTVLGEIQFGNWALVYRDILKVIQIERDEDVDLLIYISATGNLASAISDGTVNYVNTKVVFDEFKNILNMPIWLIGVDVR